MEKIKIGTSVTDITPPLETGVLMSSVKQQYESFRSVRLPLKCRVMVIKYLEELFAVVSLDLIGLNHDSVAGWGRFKNALEGPVNAKRIIITCTHTHSSLESAGLTNLYKEPAFKRWLTDLENNIKTGIDNAVRNLEHVTISVGEALLNGYSLQRRVRVNGEMVLSDSLQPITPALFKMEPIDRRVRALKFTDSSDNVLALVGHAVCHPVHEMCSSYVSPDFPGELCRYLENIGKTGMPLFLNGCCGDINPPTVSQGSDYARQHGQAIAEKILSSTYDKVVAAPVRLLSKRISVTIRKGADIANEKDGLIRLNVLRLGDTVIVFLPGEPFTTTALEIEHASPFHVTIVVGYSENYVGYIPTEEVFEEGGYETGPGRWSYLEEGTEAKIRTEIDKMLLELYEIEEPKKLNVL